MSVQPDSMVRTDRLDAPVLVFLGPSAPASDVKAHLPNAEIRPPLQRGDLHAARLLRYSVFLVIDGVFLQNDAIPPREVVDVLQDGARVIGASSMGALRACDCRLAGAVGIGRIYRMFRHSLIGSEDEVAAVFHPATIYPALTEPLVNIRVAARRARRNGMISTEAEAALISTARAMPYDQRNWPALRAATGHALPLDWLKAQDAKRADANAAFAYVSNRIARDADWAERPRKSRSTFGVLDPPRRSRRLEPGRFLSLQDRTGFTLWMLLSGRANRHLYESETLSLLAALPHPLPDVWWSAQTADTVADTLGQASERLSSALTEVAEIDAEHLRYIAVVRAVSSAGARTAPAQARSKAETQVAIAHRFDSWAALTESLPPETVEIIRALTLDLARARAGKRRKSGTGAHHDTDA